MNKNISKIINNTIIRAIILIIYYIVIIAINIPAIPYAIVKGICNTDYYKEWNDFVFKYITLKRHYY